MPWRGQYSCFSVTPSRDGNAKSSSFGNAVAFRRGISGLPVYELKRLASSRWGSAVWRLDCCRSSVVFDDQLGPSGAEHVARLSSRTAVAQRDSNPCLVTAAFSPLGSATSAPPDSNEGDGLKHVRERRPQNRAERLTLLVHVGHSTATGSVGRRLSHSVYAVSKSRLEVACRPPTAPLSSGLVGCLCRAGAATSRPVSVGHRGSAASARRGQ